MDASVRYQYTTNLELSGDSRQLQLREGEKGGDIAAGGVCGPLSACPFGWWLMAGDDLF
jgi:hypothetical protein